MMAEKLIYGAGGHLHVEGNKVRCQWRESYSDAAIESTFIFVGSLNVRV